MATFTKAHLSGAADGLAVKVAATSSTGTTVHTAVSGTTAGSFSECWIWAVNTSAAAVKLTIEWGTTTAADGNIEVTGARLDASDPRVDLAQFKGGYRICLHCQCDLPSLLCQ